MHSDNRCAPLIELEYGMITSLMSTVKKKAAVDGIELVEGGLVNTIYRIRLASGDSLCLRIFATGSRAWEVELSVLKQLSSYLPVPDVVAAGEGGPHLAHPYMIYRWIDGVTLDSCRRLVSPTDFLSLAEPLGRALAGIAGTKFPITQRNSDKVVDLGARSIARSLKNSLANLRREMVRSRLGNQLADALARALETWATRLHALDRTAGLVHGDLRARNILVAPLRGGCWQISGLIDWESAFTGAALWDVGSLFRYHRRYTETFRHVFERSYRDAGASLPEDWWPVSRLLDANRLIEVFAGDDDLPVVFAECRELLNAVLSAER